MKRNKGIGRNTGSKARREQAERKRKEMQAAKARKGRRN